MRVDWAIPCRYAEVNNNLATIVGAGINHTLVPTLPTAVQVTLAVRVVASPDELGEEQPHALTCVARDGEHNELARLGGELTIPRPPEGSGDWLVGFHFPMIVRFPVESEGTYTLEVSADSHAYPVPMHVTLRGGPPET